MMGEKIIELEHAIGFSAPAGLHYHPNGADYVYAAGASVVVCNLKNPRSQRILHGHDGNVSAVALSRSGRLVASGQRGGNSDAIIWCYRAMSVLHRLTEHDRNVAALAFSNDEYLLCTAGGVDNEKLICWDTSTGAVVTIVSSEPSPSPSIGWGGLVRDNKQRLLNSYQLCTAGGTNIFLWSINPYTGDASYNRVSMDGRGSLVRSVTCLTYDRETVYCATTTGDLVLVDVREKKVRRRTLISSHGGLAAFALMQHGGLIVGATDGTVTTLDSELQKIMQIELPGAVFSLSLASGAHNEVLVGTAMGCIYRIRAPDLSKALLVGESHASAVLAVAFSQETSGSFASASSDLSICVWDMSDYKTAAKILLRDAGNPICLVYTLDLIISGWTDGIIRAHEVGNKGTLWQIDNAHVGASVTALVLANNRRFLVSGGALGDVRVWEVRSRELVSHLKQHRGAVKCLALSRDDVHVLSCSKDGSFLSWDLRSEKRVASYTQRMGGINSIVLSHDETFVFTVGQEKRITRWDLGGTNSIAQQDLDSNKKDEANAVAISRSMNVIATGGTQCEVKLWDYQDFSYIAAVKEHTSSIQDLKFSPNSKQLVSAGEDGILCVWNVYV